MPLDSTTFAPSTLVEDLRAAREYITTHGWCQKVARDGERVCTLGAIFAVVGSLTSTGDEPRRRIAAHDALLRTMVPGVPIHLWNDVSERTVEDVLALYDETIRGLVE